MNQEASVLLMKYLLLIMQVSIVVPMAVVWRRRRHFSPTVKLLSSYVYLSAFFSLILRVAYPPFVPNNFWVLAGFNLSKIALFGAVFYRVLKSGRMRRATVVATIGSVAAIILVSSYNSDFGVSFSRVLQCAVLAAMSIAYLDQSLGQLPTRRAMADPFWVLSLGQLLYSAGTVTAFSLDYLSVTVHDQIWKYIVISLAGLVFNYFLTLVFLRAKHAEAAPEETVAAASAQLAAS